MSKLVLAKNSTNVISYIFIQDITSTTGAGLTGLVYNSASLVAYYITPTWSPCPIALAPQTPTGGFLSGGFTELSASAVPGIYRFDIPNEVYATGEDTTIVMIRGATNMYPVLMEIQLSTVDLNEALATEADIADSVWDEELSSHTGSGTSGSKLEETATLTSSEIWTYPIREITAGGTSASEVWNYTTRTLTVETGASASTIADAVWDEQLTAATHNIPTSAGRRLRQLASSIVLDCTITGATTNTISFDGDASTVNGAYDPTVITISSGCGIGQCRLVYDYNGTTKTAAVDRDWKVIPQAGDECVIVADAGREHVNEGLIVSGSTYSVQLNAFASDTEGAYVGQVLFIRSGTGADQARRVISYDGANHIATTRRPWSPIPDNTSAYVMLPTAELDIDRLIDSIWNEDLSGHTASGTAGSALAMSTAASIWGYASRTLTSIGSAIADIATAVWSFTRRTLSSASVDPIEEYQITCIRGDTFEQMFEDYDLSEYAKVYFTVKNQYKDLDEESIVQISSSSGLLYLNGSGSVSGSSASITMDSLTNIITVLIDADITEHLEYNNNDYLYDLQAIKTTGEVETLQTGKFSLIRDVTRAIT